MTDERNGVAAPRGEDRLTNMFAAAHADDRAALLPYMTAGLPRPDQSVRIFEAMADSGADGFEVGIPYADPLMDGPVIMAAGERALAAGATVDRSLGIVGAVAEGTGLPVIVMTYVNPVLHMGAAQFARAVASAGGAGLIIADLPVDEAAPFLAAARASGLGMALFAAPTIDDRRLALVGGSDPAFVYAVADLGVTGARQDASTRLDDLAARIRGVTPRPIVSGVGISTPAQAAAAARVTDGVIVGTALVRLVLDSEDVDTATRRVGEAVRSFAAATHR